MSAKIKVRERNHCSVCDLNLNSDAEFAIHEFSKRHCDNLLRVSKNKPIKQKAQIPTENQPPEKAAAEPVQVITEPGQFALYGYFTPGEEGEVKNEYAPKEYNYEYDPYLQKLAENPYKALEKAAAVAPEPEQPSVPLTHVTSFSTSKKKKKRTCQICNVSMLNIPQYDAHMKSAQHAWQLKLTGMGVSAHFVKAGANLHTTEDAEEGNNATVSSSTSSSVPIAPSDLFCDVCEMLLNSPSQFANHLTGKSHKDKVQLKQSVLAKKEKNENPTPNTLFCYSCKLALNNVAQYNDHKNGKKHKIKCRALVKSGITIPPEERTPDMHWANPSDNRPVRYPELYMKQISSQEPKREMTTSLEPSDPEVDNDMENSRTVCTAEKLECVEESMEISPSQKPGAEKLQCYKCSHCDCHFVEQSAFESHLNSEEHAVKLADVRREGKPIKEILSTILADRRVVLPDRYGRYVCGVCDVISRNSSENEQHLRSILHKYAEQGYEKKRAIEIKRMVNAEADGSYKCQLCVLSWPTLIEYNTHLHGAQHKGLSWQEYTRKHGNTFHSGSKMYEEKNPGVRTKIGGMATDLSSGEVLSVPNLEQLEPKIDPAKNVNIGLSPGGYENPRKRRFPDYSFHRPRSMFHGGYPNYAPRPPPPRGWPREPPRNHPYMPPPYHRPLRPRMPPPLFSPEWY